MILEEVYELSGFNLKCNKREIKLIFMDNIYVIYIYDGKRVGNTKEITIQRWFKFKNKYCGQKRRGYNRPSMCFKEFDTRTGKEL